MFNDDFTIQSAGAPPLPGDFDGDGDVDNNDLTDPVLGWETRFGVDLDGSDFLAWQRDYGIGVPPLVATDSVPEPSGMALLVGLAMLGVHIQSKS